MLRIIFLTLILVTSVSFSSQAEIELGVLETYESGIFDEGAAEIVA